VSKAPNPSASVDFSLVRKICDQVSANVGLIVDRSLTVGDLNVARFPERVCGKGRVHISFKLGFEYDGDLLHGCILVPLPEALTLAGSLLMLPLSGIEEVRKEKAPDQASKDALMELGNFVGGAADEALRDSDFRGLRVFSEGCQGVRAGVRPCLAGTEGTEYVVGRATTNIDDFPAFELLVLVPLFWKD